MSTLRKWIAGSTTSAALMGVATTGAFLLLANRFVYELSRPGVVIDEESPVWGGWKFPTGSPEPPPELRRSIDFHASDGTLLKGEFWAQPQPAPTIVLSHGFRLPSEKFRAVGALEYSHGCNIMLFDYRGHGQSEPLPTSGGNAEVRDLSAAITVAAHQPETLAGSIFIHGFSMGAAVALLLPPRPEVAGIIADSPYAQLEEMIHRLMVWQILSEADRLRIPHRASKAVVPPFTTATLWGGRVLFKTRYGESLIARPEKVLLQRARLRARGKGIGSPPPVLLIHAVGDPLIPLEHAKRIEVALRQSGSEVETYFVPTSVHCGGYGFDPDVYNGYLKGFVDRYRSHVERGDALH